MNAKRPLILALGLVAVAIVALVVTARWPQATARPIGSSAVFAAESRPAMATASASPPLVPSPTAGPTQSAGPPGFLTIDQIPIHGYTDRWFRNREGVELTLGGPAVYFLDPVETIETAAGEHLLTFFLHHCDNPLGCPSGTRGIPPRVLCTHSLTLAPGESLLVRVDFTRDHCVRLVRPRPPRPSHPKSISGQLLFGNRYCPYLLDRWGRFWDLRLPGGWAVEKFRFKPALPGIIDAVGGTVAHERDLIRVTGTRTGVHSTGCSMHEEDSFGAGYLPSGITFVSKGH
jgi:hypothetical protein